MKVDKIIAFTGGGHGRGKTIIRAGRMKELLDEKDAKTFEEILQKAIKNQERMLGK